MTLQAVVGRYVYSNPYQLNKQVEKSGEFISRLNLALIPITSAPLQCSLNLLSPGVTAEQNVHGGKLAKAQNKNKLTKAARRFHTHSRPNVLPQPE